MDSSIGNILRSWRKRRRFSQLSLALDAGISPRHLSFIESGRARPSREMVLKLTRCLEMPQSEINHTLLAAGFAPVFKAHRPNSAQLAPLHAAVKVILDNHMPYPAIVLDQGWTIVNANRAASAMLTLTGFAQHPNLIDAMCARSATQSSIINWEEVVSLLLARLNLDVSSMANVEEFAKRIARLQDHFDRYKSGAKIDHTQAIIPTHFKIDAGRLSLFSSVMQFSTLQDVALENMKIELMFPMDSDTGEYFRAQFSDGNSS